VISVLLSNVYLHYVLDLWFERVVKPRLSRVRPAWCRYIDDFVLCFQFRSGCASSRSRKALAKRLSKFQSDLGAEEDQAVEFGRYGVIARDGQALVRKRPETIYFLALLCKLCTRNQKGKAFRIAMLTETVTTATRALCACRTKMRRMRHLVRCESRVNHLNQMLRWSLCILRRAGNLRALLQVYKGCGTSLAQKC